jgi:hypothetical protein
MLTEACTCASFRNNTTVNEGVDSGKGGRKQFITWGAQAHLIESNMHPAAKASPRSLRAWLTGLDQHGRRPWSWRGTEGGEEKKKVTFTGAQVLILVAWRGSARAANKMQPEDDFTVASPGAPQWRFYRRAHSHRGPLIEAQLAS